MILNKEKTRNYIIDWIKTYSQKYNIKNLFVDVYNSDSVLVALLCKETKINTIAIMDCHYNDENWHIQDNFQKFCKDNMSSIVIDTSGPAQSTRHLFATQSLPKAKLNAKLLDSDKHKKTLTECVKTPIISCLANTYQGLVVGTKNRCDLNLIRNYKKYGSGAVDILPIGDMFQSETNDLLIDMVMNTYGISYDMCSYALSITGESFNNDSAQLTYDKVEWVDKQNSMNNIITSPEDPVRHKDWPRYTSRQREIIAQIHQIEKRTRHKHNPNLPICKLRDIPGLLQ